MKEISQLVSRFDERIVLSANKLYEKFGRENGAQVLEPWFSRVEWISYEDGLLVSDPEPLISYILSCHGNQNQYLLDHYKEFRSFVKKKTEKGLHITKDAGNFYLQLLNFPSVFLCPISKNQQFYQNFKKMLEGEPKVTFYNGIILGYGTEKTNGNCSVPSQLRVKMHLNLR